MSARTLTDVQRREILRLRACDTKLIEIAGLVGCSKSSVDRTLAEPGARDEVERIRAHLNPDTLSVIENLRRRMQTRAISDRDYAALARELRAWSEKLRKDEIADEEYVAGPPVIHVHEAPKKKTLDFTETAKMFEGAGAPPVTADGDAVVIRADSGKPARKQPGEVKANPDEDMTLRADIAAAQLGIRDDVLPPEERELTGDDPFPVPTPEVYE